MFIWGSLNVGIKCYGVRKIHMNLVRMINFPKLEVCIILMTIPLHHTQFIAKQWLASMEKVPLTRVQARQGLENIKPL